MQLPKKVIKLVRRIWISDSNIKELPEETYILLYQYADTIWLKFGIDILFYDNYEVRFYLPNEVHQKIFHFKRPLVHEN